MRTTTNTQQRLGSGKGCLCQSAYLGTTLEKYIVSGGIQFIKIWLEVSHKE